MAEEKAKKIRKKARKVKAEVSVGANLGNILFASFWLLLWLYGIVLAQGYIQTTLAIFIPPYAGYLGVEKLAGILGLL